MNEIPLPYLMAGAVVFVKKATRKEVNLLMNIKHGKGSGYWYSGPKHRGARPVGDGRYYYNSNFVELYRIVYL